MGQRNSSVDSNSIKLGATDRGAVAAKPHRSACISERPCALTKAVLASSKSSLPKVRLMKVPYGIARKDATYERKPSDEAETDQKRAR